MKRLLLTGVLVGLLAILALVTTALVRDPYLIWFQSERVLKAADVTVIHEGNKGRSGTVYTLETKVGPIVAVGKLGPDSRILPTISFSHETHPHYSIVNSLLALTFFRLLGLFIALICSAGIIYELRNEKRSRTSGYRQCGLSSP
jgi:hypothetical protein